MEILKFREVSTLSRGHSTLIKALGIFYLFVKGI